MGHGPLSISEMWSSVLLWCWSTKYACACVACTDLSPRAFTCAHAFVFIVCLSPLWRVRTSSTHIHTLIPILRARSSCVRVHVEFFVYNNIPGNHKAVGLHFRDLHFKWNSQVLCFKFTVYHSLENTFLVFLEDRRYCLYISIYQKQITKLCSVCRVVCDRVLNERLWHPLCHSLRDFYFKRCKRCSAQRVSTSHFTFHSASVQTILSEGLLKIHESTLFFPSCWEKSVPKEVFTCIISTVSRGPPLFLMMLTATWWHQERKDAKKNLLCHAICHVQNSYFSPSLFVSLYHGWIILVHIYSNTCILQWVICCASLFRTSTFFREQNSQ